MRVDEETRRPSDQATRDRIASDLGRTLFVEAGAGSGKTRALVDRVLALVASGVPLENVAVITFTEKAAAELRDRIRQQLEGSDRPSTVGLDPAAAGEALDQLDNAAVGTLHSFAQSILSDHPIEAGLPPVVEVLDEISAQIVFEIRWRSFLDELLDDTDMSAHLLTLEAFNVRLRQLRSLAVKLNDNWDRLQGLPTPPGGARLEIDAGRVLAAAGRVLGLRRHCRDADDKLMARIKIIAERADHFRDVSADGDHVLAIQALQSLAADCKAARVGTKRNWGVQLREARGSVLGLRGVCEEALERAAARSLECLTARIARFAVDSAEHRRRSGCLDFHDLLVRALHLLRHPVHGEAVREALRDRYRHLLLDEFQDTDPIQVEMAVMLASPPVKAMSSGALGRSWSNLECEPGRLFFVGDPKQSIYRFRRADIATYLQTRAFVHDGPAGGVETLTTNFRCTVPIIDWVNTVFGRLIEYAEGSQPEYQPLDAWRAAAPEGPAVTVLGERPTASADPADDGPDDLGRGSGARRLRAAELREREALAVASVVTLILDRGWDVLDDDGERWRRARPSDIAILIPDRNSMDALEDALSGTGIPYRAEASSLVYSTSEVRDVLIALQALADPTDEVALVAALRSPLYGCGDDDLAHWKLGVGGRFSLIAEQPEIAAEDHPVAEALEHLRGLLLEKRWENPSLLLERLIRERGVYEKAMAARRPRDVWRRLRFLVDQARAWADAGGATLRGYLGWARLQGDERSRVTETILPETDDDSVRILTVHGAKGLEFPVAVVAGMTSRLSRPQRGPAVALSVGQAPAVRVKAGVQTSNYEAQHLLEQEMERDERLRLLYVACTRARDHLVVSLHRAADGSAAVDSAMLRSADDAKTYAEALAAVGAADVRGVYSHETASHATPFTQPGTASSGIAMDRPQTMRREQMPGRDEWQAELADCLRRAAIPAAVSPTRLARMPAQGAPRGGFWAGAAVESSRASQAGASEPGIDHAEPVGGVGRPPGSRSGRAYYGTAVGKAVHAVLQEVDLATGEDLEAQARHHASAEGVFHLVALVEDLARSALESETAKQAAASRHWREVFVAAPVVDGCGILVEGYIDLMYRSRGGLVVVDWKTDAVESAEDVASRMAAYRLQGAAYAAALEAATGESVARVEFVFLRRGGESVAVAVEGLRTAIAEVQEIIQQRIK